MILDFIFEHIPISKQLPVSTHVAFSEHILVLRQLPGFISMSILKVFTHIKQNKIFFINKIGKKLFFYNLKFITAFRNQNINIIRSYNAGNCSFKMLENKSFIFSNLTHKMWKLRF